MRLIDADEIMKALSIFNDSENGNRHFLYGIRTAKELIEDAPTVGGWISVKDRLPKSMANKVLVWLEHEDLVGYIGFGHYEKFEGVEMWYDLEHGEPFAKHGYTVSHWMPLPEPPKEGE